MLSSSSYVLDLQSILDLKRVLGFFFLLLTIIKYCLCTPEWKPFQMIFSFDYHSLTAGHFGHFAFFFSFMTQSFFCAHLITPSLPFTYLSMITFHSYNFWHFSFRACFFSLCLCLLLGQWNQFRHPVDTTHTHFWLSLGSRQIKFCFLFHLVPNILLRHY